MKRYLIDLVGGFVIGIIFAWGPTLVTGDYSSVPFADFFLDNFPFLVESFFLFYVPYAILAILPFGVYTVTPYYKKIHPTPISFKILLISYAFFATGVYLATFSYLIVGLIDFSLSSFPF